MAKREKNIFKENGFVTERSNGGMMYDNSSLEIENLSNSIGFHTNY